MVSFELQISKYLRKAFGQPNFAACPPQERFGRSAVDFNIRLNQSWLCPQIKSWAIYSFLGIGIASWVRRMNLERRPDSLIGPGTTPRVTGDWSLVLADGFWARRHRCRNLHALSSISSGNGRAIGAERGHRLRFSMRKLENHHLFCPVARRNHGATRYQRRFGSPSPGFRPGRESHRPDGPMPSSRKKAARSDVPGSSAAELCPQSSAIGLTMLPSVLAGMDGAETWGIAAPAMPSRP